MQRVVTTAGTTERFYHNGFEYGGSGIELVHTGEGVVNVSTSDNNHRYNYFLKDHLGSTRVVFGEDTQGELIVNQVTDYYAFGLAHEPGFGMGDTRYLYNGKELQDDLSLDWLDYGWRMYDPQIGRWHVIDPLAEKYSSYSPYNYVLNNPVRYVDPDGLSPSSGDGDTGQSISYETYFQFKDYYDQYYSVEFEEGNRFLVCNKSGQRIGVGFESTKRNRTLGDVLWEIDYAFDGRSESWVVDACEVIAGINPVVSAIQSIGAFSEGKHASGFFSAYSLAGGIKPNPYSVAFGVFCGIMSQIIESH